MTDHGSCSKCTFFDDQKKDKTHDGLCRYNPPVTQPGPTEHGLWPVVSSADWCGHFSKGAAQVAAE
jgi:hypothetical protein